MDIIFIKDLALEASVGVYPHEKTAKQPIILDLELYTDISQAAKTDSISDALDYDLVVNRITEIVAIEHFNLLETLVCKIADTLLQTFNIKKLRCAVNKPQAILNAKAVGIVIERPCV